MHRSSLSNTLLAPTPRSNTHVPATLATTTPAPSSPRLATRSPASPLSTNFASTPAPTDPRVRLPKKAPDNPARNDFRDAVTRDALRDQEANRVASTAQSLALAPSPLSSPVMSVSSDPRAALQRKTSVESTTSSLNAATINASSKTNGLPPHRESQGNGPVDISALIAAAGSPEAAIQKLINEKQQTTNHNAQLWRLVEKQRAMILGLNKDLEKSLKEKEKYRKKLKDSLAHAASTPLAEDGSLARETSHSPAHSATVLPLNLRDKTIEVRKVSDASSDATPGRSDTPQDAVSPGAGSLASSPPFAGKVKEEPKIKGAQVQESDLKFRSTTPTSPPGSQSQHKQADSLTLPNSPLKSPQSISSPKQANRKAPPAPLQLSPAPVSITNNLMDPSDSEYEDDVEKPRAEQVTRGRRKTREEDDREREMAFMEEAEHRSRSKKEKKSKSKPPVETNVPAAPSAESAAAVLDPSSRAPEKSDAPAIVKQQIPVQALPRGLTAPALMSPGLPMSPRPGDRPMNSPMPRAPNKALNSMPLSPRSGMAGLPLSPRAPRQPIPLPPQAPAGITSPHLARAEAYHQQAQSQHGSIADRLNDASPEKEIPTNSRLKTPGEVYTGLVTEQYPDLLLPPNALPSVLVVTSSSRMRPSRQSYIAPKHPDDNPVLTLAVHERADNKQLWRVEKTLGALAVLDAQVKAACAFRERLPDKALFAGHAPAKIDARRIAIDAYFESLLDFVTEDKVASVICRFLSTDAIGADATVDYFNGAMAPETRPDTPVAAKPARSQRAGYLTKKGKNFGGWKARYFVLDGPSLRYFEAPGGAHLGSIKLQNAQIGKQQQPAASEGKQEDEDNQYRHAFLILEPKKKDSSSLVRHVLCAESDAERDGWVDSLLQYVDIKEEDDTASKASGQGVKHDSSGPRSPRLQKSQGDPQPSSRTKNETLRGVNYEEVTAGDAPTMGPPTGGKPETPSPASTETTLSHPVISGPSNPTMIANTEDWGMKAPPTPAVKELAKDKKRSMFSAFRGRSSSDLAPGGTSPSQTSPDANALTAILPQFGVPLVEAVQHARPANASTDLPAVVYRCFEYLTVKNAVAEEGIFRVSGSSALIKSLRDRFDTEGDVDLVNEPTYYDIHAVASLLKLFLRELPVSILTREMHMEFLACNDLKPADKIPALNVLVNKLPAAHRALLEALSTFLALIVDNSAVNKMNIRNVGIIFAPALNVPATLILSFVEERAVIFGTPIDEIDSPTPTSATSEVAPLPGDLRSPRKQMFTDLPTPAYNQTTFQSLGGIMPGDTGMVPMQPSYGNYAMASHGEGGFASLNDALRAPSFSSDSSGSHSAKARRRESGMMLLSPNSGPSHKQSNSRLRHEEGASF